MKAETQYTLDLECSLVGEGVLLAEGGDLIADLCEGGFVAFGFDDLVDPVGDEFHLGFFESAGGGCGGSEADSGGDHW